MKDLDPGMKQQKALPVEVCCKAMKQASASAIPHLNIAITQLLLIAFFWCMRSCKYSKVQGEQRTTSLVLQNISFLDATHREIPQLSPVLS